jgi:flagellar motor protein MotB
MKHWWSALIVAACTQAAADTYETVCFVADDLSSSTVYFSSRSDDSGDPSFHFPADFDRNLVLYARPENYRWQQRTIKGESFRQLLFPNTSSYAFLQRKSNRSEFLETRGPTSYTLKVDGNQCIDDGCQLDENIISVVVPKRFKVTQYGGSPRGTWKIVDNTFTYYARNVKGARVEIDFEDRYAATFDSVNASMEKLKGVEVRNVEGTIKIIMPMDNVFASGSVVMSPQGTAWVKLLAAALKSASLREIRIEGHADNAPIKSTVFPSNWELSSARAAQVARLFLAEGLPAARLMAAGYADSRPIAEGDTPEARARNRRIEFTAVPALP